MPLNPGAGQAGAVALKTCTTAHIAGEVIRNDGNGGQATTTLTERLPACGSGEGARQRATGTIRTLVAMPAYNEETYIAKTIVGIGKHADAILVVDDGSVDDTAVIARALGAIVVRHETNRGYGGALQTIFCTAREMEAEELVIIDSDGQHNPWDIPRLLAELRRGIDIVIGSRFAGGPPEEIPTYRKVGMKVLDTATIVAGNGIAVTDSQSGFRAYGKRAIETIHICDKGMSAGSEILIQASDHHLTVAEVPIRVRYDIEGASSKDPISHGVEVLVNIIRLISFRRPLLFFGIPGLIFTLSGIGAEVHTFSELYRTGQFHYILFTGGFSMLILGLLLIAVGMILYSLVQIMQSQGGERKSAGPAGATLYAEGSATAGEEVQHTDEEIPKRS